MTNAEARFNKSLRPRKPEGSLGRTAQDVHLDSHTAPELCVMEFGEEGDYNLYLSLHCHHQNDSCIKMGSDENHFSFVNCEGQNHKTMSTNHNFQRGGGGGRRGMKKENGVPADGGVKGKKKKVSEGGDKIIVSTQFQS